MPAVEELLSNKQKNPKNVDGDNVTSSSDEELKEEKQQLEANEAEGYENENSEVRKIDHPMCV